MFYSSTKHIFISHAWKYNDDYNTIVSWLNEENITWKNYSVPEHDPLDANNTQKLKGALTEQIRHANIVIIIGGMYANYSNWIEYEVDEAKRMYKKIILIEPWGQQRIPQYIQNAASITIGWNRNSLINAIV